MKIIQLPITANHKSAMFFDGVIATAKSKNLDGDYSLVTYQDGELVYNDKLYVGKEILALIGIINDTDIEDEVTVDIHVDKFFSINYNGTVLEDLIFCDYDEAIAGFQEFINKI
jgi:hypothetical protein